MYIKEIELYNFRNYREEKVSFSENVNIFLGSNAQGKTNMLEGIYLNSIGKSFKNVRDKELVRFGEEFCRVKTVFESSGEERTTETVISKEGKKGIKADGIKVTKTSELLDRIFTVVFSPEDLKIVKEDPEKRRKFIDRELCQIRAGYLSDLNDYRRILKQRNTYLKEERINEGLLDVWDRQLAECGSRLVKKRKEFIEKTDKISGEIHSLITGGKEKLNLKYEPSVYFEEKMEEGFCRLLHEFREDDIRNGTTGRGPHRDDFRISADGIDLRRFGSQGQQRTAALSLKLSEIRIIEDEKGEKPILLLDDVLSELDNERQLYLINSLGENQMFITTTDLIGKVARNLPEGKIFKISNGEVEIEI